MCHTHSTLQPASAQADQRVATSPASAVLVWRTFDDIRQRRKTLVNQVAATWALKTSHAVLLLQHVEWDEQALLIPRESFATLYREAGLDNCAPDVRAKLMLANDAFTCPGGCGCTPKMNWSSPALHAWRLLMRNAPEMHATPTAPFIPTVELACGHRFCVPCWQRYLITVVEWVPGPIITCKQQGCTMLVVADVLAAIADSEVMRKFDAQLDRAYLKAQPSFCMCSSPGCTHIVERLDESESWTCVAVTCLGGHHCTIACQQTSHEPLPCHLVRQLRVVCDRPQHYGWRFFQHEMGNNRAALAMLRKVQIHLLKVLELDSRCAAQHITEVMAVLTSLGATLHSASVALAWSYLVQKYWRPLDTEPAAAAHFAPLREQLELRVQHLMDWVDKTFDLLLVRSTKVESHSVAALLQEAIPLAGQAQAAHARFLALTESFKLWHPTMAA